MIFSPEEYSLNTDQALLTQELNKILKEAEELQTEENLKTIFSLLDLTSLKETDNETGIKELTEKVNQFPGHFPQLPEVASICIYPEWVHTVKKNLQRNEVGITSVTGGFPASQTFIDVKSVETALAVKAGASEIDMVISSGKFLDGDWNTVAQEIVQIKDACQEKHLKVILETGSLETPENIKNASFLAMESGADFIKTSTGKAKTGATPEAFLIMCKAVKIFHEKTGKKIGLKPAGGISSAATALVYFAIVKNVLGNQWLNKNLFRIGAGNLANALLSSIENKNISYF
ncbi:MAG: deoxyribose-phosphate aldolase [Bacteroidia bacterium]|nr:MAG: deoxyribose-phosphate aldolase [Bacteroidia bacterium]